MEYVNQNVHLAMRSVDEHMREMRAAAGEDRRARAVSSARERRGLRRGVGHLLIGLGTALVERSLDPAYPERGPVAG